MIFRETPIEGLWLVEWEPTFDERGYFARVFSRKDFEERGLPSRWDHCSLSFNERRGTIRGLHWQKPPFTERKLLFCARGRVYDVVVDLRPGSSTYARSFSIELSADAGLAIYVPPLFAHGFQTLEESSGVYYHISGSYRPDHATGARYDDPTFGIEWPLPVSVISRSDEAFPPFQR